MQIAAKLVDDALALGSQLSVYDGEEWALRRSQESFRPTQSRRARV